VNWPGSITVSLLPPRLSWQKDGATVESRLPLYHAATLRRLDSIARTLQDNHAILLRLQALLTTSTTERST
jgi:hypothetical protein